MFQGEAGCAVQVWFVHVNTLYIFRNSTYFEIFTFYGRETVGKYLIGHLLFTSQMELKKRINKRHTIFDIKSLSQYF